MTPKIQKLVIVEKIDPMNLKYKLSLTVAIEIDKDRSLSSISPRVILIEDIHAFIHCKIEDICQGEIDTTYKNMCVNGNLKSDHTHL